MSTKSARGGQRARTPKLASCSLGRHVGNVLFSKVSPSADVDAAILRSCVHSTIPTTVSLKPPFAALVLSTFPTCKVLLSWALHRAGLHVLIVVFPFLLNSIYFFFHYPMPLSALGNDNASGDWGCLIEDDKKEEKTTECVLSLRFVASGQALSVRPRLRSGGITQRYISWLNPAKFSLPNSAVAPFPFIVSAPRRHKARFHLTSARGPGIQLMRFLDALEICPRLFTPSCVLSEARFYLLHRAMPVPSVSYGAAMFPLTCQPSPAALRGNAMLAFV